MVAEKGRARGARGDIMELIHVYSYMLPIVEPWNGPYVLER